MIAIARAAGQSIMPFFRRDTLARTKPDHAPGTDTDTDTDEAADALLA